MSEKKYLTIEEFIALPKLSNLSISEDGKKIAYVKRLTNWDNNTYQYHVCIYENGNTYPLTQGKNESLSPKWSPDGKTLAYLSRVNDKDKKKQILIKPDREVLGIQVSHATEDVVAFKWSPSGQGFFFLAREVQPKSVKQRREIYGDIEIVDREYLCNCLFYLDLQKGLEKTNASLTLPKDLREPTENETDNNKSSLTDDLSVQLTEGKTLHIYEFDISPKVDKVAFIAAPSPNLEELEKTELYLLDVESKEMKKLEIPLVGRKSNVLFSPDGAFICFTYHREGKNYYNQKLAILHLNSGNITYPQIEIDENIYPLRWITKGILIWWQQKTNSYIGISNDQGHIIPLVPLEDGYIQTASITSDGEHLAYLKASSQKCNEIYIDDVCITNESIILKNRLFAQKKIISWSSLDGNEIEGIISTPIDFDSSKKYPLLVIVHGGPTSTSLPIALKDSIYSIESFIEKGFIVLQPNYRGSAGYGEAFRSLNYRDLGIGDYADVISGVDFLISQGFIDGEKVGIMGWSQGGYISAFCATYSDRFKAISVGAGISNWITNYVSTDIHQFTRRYLGDTPWNDPEVYRRTSPMTYIKSACTPTLIQHGDNDKRVPVSNAYELYQGLRDVGVDTELVIFKNMAHGSNKPGITRAIMKQNLIWFCHHILGERKDGFDLLSLR